MLSMPGGRLFWDVDTQVDFMCPDGCLFVPGAQDIVENLRALTEGARRLGIPIVHSTDEHEMSDDEISERRADFIDTFPPHCLRGTAGAERIPETAAAPDALDIPWDGSGIDAAAIQAASEIVIRKKRFDVFANPAAEMVLDARAPETVVVYGVALDVCARYAVDGILDRGGVDVVVALDAVAAVVPGTGRDLLANWRRRGVRIMPTAEVLAECESLLSGPG